jgi:Domain of unknown function (DUF4350)
MNGESVFSRRLLIVWIVAAVLTFAVSLYFMGSKDQGDTVGPSAYSRSAIGYAGIADVLHQLGIDVVKSRYDSLGKLTPGSVLVIAEPRPSPATERTIRTLLKADTILLVLPKWAGAPSRRKSGWLGKAELLSRADADWVLHFVAPRAEVFRGDEEFWTTNTLDIAPSLQAPIQLMRGGGLRPLIGGKDGMLLGEVSQRGGQFLQISDPSKPLQRGTTAIHKRRIWVLSDPDVIANHGFAATGNAALAVAMIKHLLAGSGRVVFDETLHGFITQPAGPLLLPFRFPFIVATIQGVVAIGLLLWATLGRFGAPQPAPPPMSAGRLGLLQNIAKLVEFTGHHEVMVRRYVFETVRDVARQLHAPRGLSTTALVAWLQRVGAARGISTDCSALMNETEALADGRRRNAASLVRLARDIHRWREEIVDGRARNPRDR